MKETKKILAVVLIMCLFLGGCGRQTGADLGENSATTQQESVTGTGGEAEAESTNETVNNGEYVADNFVVSDDSAANDYQAGLEPIPEEIAELGGLCQGTVYAFPALIKAGLTEKRMEEDPELKEEVERRSAEVEKELEENIGGEFRVDGVVAYDSVNWFFICTEVETGYQFDMLYIICDHSQPLHSLSGNKLYLEDYYDAEESARVQETFSTMIQESFGECLHKVWAPCDEHRILVEIHEFTNQEVDKAEEQRKLLSLWEDMRAYSENMLYRVRLFYWQPEYQSVMEQRYSSDVKINTWTYPRVSENGELKAHLCYDGFEGSMDEWVEQCHNGSCDPEELLPYWEEAINSETGGK